jgi:predicted DNA-binding protein YlxM (UPF0122 family)
MSEKNQLTTVDQRLQALACSDWLAFVSLLGVDAHNRLKVCIMRRENKSFRQIANNLKVSKGSVQNSCKKCPE